MDEYEAEVAAIADYLVAAGVNAVLVTFGGGCDFSRVDPLKPIPVAPALLPSFVDDQDESGVYRLSASDLFIKADGGGVSFLLCEEADIHCYTDDPRVVTQVRERWARAYSGAYEADRSTRRWRSLRGGPWQPFADS
jgi:hypothetical protein